MGVLIGIALFIAVSIFTSWMTLRVADDDTFDAYMKRHPDLVKDGKVKCVKCGGSSIWMKQLENIPFIGAKYVHKCRNCGSDLYRSRHKV